MRAPHDQNPEGPLVEPVIEFAGEGEFGVMPVGVGLDVEFRAVGSDRIGPQHPREPGHGNDLDAEILARRNLGGRFGNRGWRLKTGRGEKNVRDWKH